MTLRLGIDIGGTFTDLVTVDQTTGALRLLKTPSIPDHPSRAVITGIGEMVDRDALDPGAITYFVHGTTLALNTVIQRSGARTGLIVTEGFGDVLELQRLRLPDPHHFNADRPRSLVPRHLVREVDERVLANGDVMTPLAVDAVADAARDLAAHGIEAIAICFLHAYRNPAHEIAATAAITEVLPELYVGRSSDIWPQQREYERALVTVINSYVGATMRRYFTNVQQEVAGLGIPAVVLSTKSNGGVMTAEAAGRAPVQTLVSGPASGVIGAQYVGQLAGVDHLLTFDMGGTSADMAVIAGSIALSTNSKVGDFPMILPAVDISSIGAGGGSIVWTDHFGVLKVGPRSAGAAPGPACYARGGEAPTVTDAYLVSGMLDPNRFLGGTMPLDPARGRSAVATVGKELGLTPEAAAAAILQVATANMYADFVPALAQHGVDPADFALFPYGGAGPTHAFLLADEVGLTRVIVPTSPGTLCALGCLVADLRADFIRTIGAECSLLDDRRLADAFAETDAEARAWLADQQVAVAEAVVLHSADMRYKGQSFEITVEFPAEALLSTLALVAAFHRRYAEIYGYADPAAGVEVVNIRGSIVGRVNKPELARMEPARQTITPRGSRTVHHAGGELNTAVYDRTGLGAGHRFSGPAIIEQYDTTTFITPGWQVEVDQFGNLIAKRELDVR